MNEPTLSRSIKATFEGPAIGPGWVPVPELVAVLEGLQSAIFVVVEDLWGRHHRPGPVPSEIQRQATFQLGQVRGGSFGVTLTLQPPEAGESQLFDVQPEAVNRLLAGITAQVAGRAPDLPADARRHVEAVISRMRRTDDRLIIEGGTGRHRAVISAETAVAGEPMAPEPVKVRRAGRLLEIDYRDRSAELWDAQGYMTRIRFREDQQAEVDAARLQHVAVEGQLEVAPSGRTGPLILESLTAIAWGEQFWHAPSVWELADEQGVRPIEDPASLVASFWEENDEEDFLAALRRWRHEL